MISNKHYWLNPEAYIVFASVLAIPPMYAAMNIKMMRR